MSSVLSRELVDGLRAQFSGDVLGPDDVGYDEARAVHNGFIDKRPALITRCANTADSRTRCASRAPRGSRSLLEGVATTSPGRPPPKAV